jgi:hypothetical protein
MLGPPGVQFPLFVPPAGGSQRLVPLPPSQGEHLRPDGLTERSPLAVASVCCRVPEAPPGKTPGGVLVVYGGLVVFQRRRSSRQRRGYVRAWGRLKEIGPSSCRAGEGHAAEDDVDGIAGATFEIAAAEMALCFHMSDHAA